MEMNVDQISLLARIRLKEEEKKRLSRDLENILGYVKQLDELDTREVPPTSHVLQIENVFRADELRPQDVTEDALRHAPEREGNFFKVPKVIEGE
jgi:aspartyl-tRNA(Asn)/glutamyl-tRNA(Gln) amidotransferase subunit C